MTGIGCSCTPASSFIGTGVWVSRNSRSQLHFIKIIVYTDRWRSLLWGSEVKQSPPSVRYEDIMASEEGVACWTSKIVSILRNLLGATILSNTSQRQYGFCYVDGCPSTPEATQQLLERIAFIRATHYGDARATLLHCVAAYFALGAFWDFTSDLSLKDTAYTSLALGAHTDTTYFTDPAGLQMFHLLSHTEGSGGASLLVDGFRAAAILKAEAPNAYHILRSTPVSTHSSGNDGISIQPSIPFPVFNEHPITGDLYQVRWNNDDRATMDHWNDEADIDAWYNAARIWTRILRSESIEYWEQLRPGRPLSMNAVLQ